MKKAYRASLLRFDAAGRPLFDEDGLLVVAPDAQGRQRVLDAGSASSSSHVRSASSRIAPSNSTARRLSRV